MSKDRNIFHCVADAAPEVPTGRSHGALDRLADFCVQTALGRRGPARCAASTSAVVVEVPAAAWITPIAQALERLLPSAKIVQASRTKTGLAFDEERAVRSLGGGRSVIAVTTAKGLLPSSFLTVVDFDVTVDPPPTAAIRAVIGEVCDGSARHLKAGDVAGLGLVDLAAAIRPGSAKEAIERLRRASARKVQLTLAVPDAPLVADIVGYGEAKQWAIDAAADFAAIRAGQSVRLTSAILAGPPGTGKTTLAQSIARSAGVPLISTSVATWFSGSRGDLDGVIRAMQTAFQTAVEAAPCALFIDELDALPSRERLSSRGADWWLPVITGTLLAVDTLRASGKPVLLMGATNFIAHVEPALQRPGRFDRVIQVSVPEGSELAAVFRQHLGSNLTDAEIATVVRLVRRATGAQVVGWVEAARRAAAAADRPIERDDLLAATVPADRRTHAERRRVALHETGHVVAALTCGMPVSEVTILPNAEASGRTAVVVGSADTREALAAQIVTALAGRAADEIVGEGPGAGAAEDLAAATRIAAASRASFGLAGKLLHNDPEAIRHRLVADAGFAADVEADLQAALAEARAIVTKHQQLVEVIADALMRRSVLDATDLRKLVGDQLTEPATVSNRSEKTASPRKRVGGSPDRGSAVP